jgi:hypothetical protein
MKLICLFLSLLLISPAVTARGDDLPATPAPTGFVSALPAPDVTVSAGKATTVKLQFSVKSGYHINANHPYSDLQIPTELKLDLPANFNLGKVTYPQGIDITLSFSPEKFKVYTGDFTVEAALSAPRSMAPGSYHVDGVLRYQACTDHACYPPKKLPVGFDVKVLAASAARSVHPSAQN